MKQFTPKFAIFYLVFLITTEAVVKKRFQLPLWQYITEGPNFQEKTYELYVEMGRFLLNKKNLTFIDKALVNVGIWSLIPLS